MSNPIKRAMAYGQLLGYSIIIPGSKFGSNLGNDNFYYKNYIVDYYSESNDGLIFYSFKRWQGQKVLSPETVTVISYAIAIGLVIGIRGSGIGRKYLDHVY